MNHFELANKLDSYIKNVYRDELGIITTATEFAGESKRITVTCRNSIDDPRRNLPTLSVVYTLNIFNDGFSIRRNISLYDSEIDEHYFPIKPDFQCAEDILSQFFVVVKTKIAMDAFLRRLYLSVKNYTEFKETLNAASRQGLLKTNKLLDLLKGE